MNTTDKTDRWDARTRLLIGDEGCERLSRASVLIAGIGGVGGYVAETLARSGIGELTLVDADTVSASNINRQIIALRTTLGTPKTDLFAQRIADINPECRLRLVPRFLTPEDAGPLLESAHFSFVADCIDTVASKVELLAQASRMRIPVISSMGAGGRINPTRIMYADLWETRQDGLARAVRDSFKRRGYRPSIPVVYSDEAPRPSALVMESSLPGKRSSFGTLATIPAIFGLYISSYIIRKITRQ